MKRLFLLLTVVVAVTTSCQKDATYVETSKENVKMEQTTSPYAVSEEKALERLDAELTALYGDDTRSSLRRVRKIQPIKLNNVAPVTRSTELDVDNLLYIVEFEDNQGSAVLGADERVESVFAVLDEGVISAEDFENAANGVKTDELSTYLAGAITNEAVEQLSLDRGLIVIPPISDLRYSYYEYDTIVNENRQRFLHTKWHQDAPYNNLCYNSNGDKCVAGCVTICAAQVLLYNPIQSIYEINVGGKTFDRTLLNMKRHGVTIPEEMVDSVNNEVSRYVATLADVLDITLGRTASSGYTRDIVDLMNSIGYSNPVYVGGDTLTFDSYVRDQIYIRGLPAPFRGSDINGEGGHSWVIDGYLKQTIERTYVTVEGSTVISRDPMSPINNRKVHCNYGWGGRCDGYYSYGIFDTSEALNTNNIVTNIGDLSGQTNYIFNNGNAMVIYDI